MDNYKKLPNNNGKLVDFETKYFIHVLIDGLLIRIHEEGFLDEEDALQAVAHGDIEIAEKNFIIMPVTRKW